MRRGESKQGLQVACEGEEGQVRAFGFETSFSPGAPIDLDHVLGEIGGDETFLRELLDEFVDNARTQLATIQQAVDLRTAEIVAREAHAIRGGAANLTAARLATAAQMLEDLGRSGSLDHADAIVTRLEEELVRLEHFVHQWR